MLDSGMPYKIDRERFAFIRLPDMKHVTIAAILAPDGTSSPNVIINTYTFDLTSNNGSPTRGTATLTSTTGSDRVIWIGAVADGLGMLMWEQKAQQTGFTVYKLSQADLLSGSKVLQPTQSQRVDVVTNPISYDVNGAALLPIAADDYFLLGLVGKNTSFNVAARLKGAGTQTAVVTPATVDGYFSTGMVKVGSNIHVATFTGSMAMVTSTEVDFDIVTAVKGPSTPVTSDLLFAAVPSGNDYATTFIEGDLGTATIKGVRVGTLPMPYGSQANQLAFTPLTATEYNLNGLAYAQWWTFDPMHSPAFITASSPPSGGGVSFLWFDGNGFMHAKSLLMKEKGNIASVSFIPFGIPTDGIGRFQTAFVTTDANDIDTIWYGQVLCTP
jgi:hypothetical protein